MKIEVRALDYSTDAETVHFARCCVGFELGNFRDRIETVRLALTDAEPARAGRQHRCRVEVEVEVDGGHDLIAEASDMDLHVAIHQACERAGWKLACRLQLEMQRGRGLTVSGGRGEPDRAA